MCELTKDFIENYSFDSDSFNRQYQEKIKEDIYTKLLKSKLICEARFRQQHKEFKLQPLNFAYKGKKKFNFGETSKTINGICSGMKIKDYIESIYGENAMYVDYFCEVTFPSICQFNFCNEISLEGYKFLENHKDDELLPRLVASMWISNSMFVQKLREKFDVFVGKTLFLSKNETDKASFENEWIFNINNCTTYLTKYNRDAYQLLSAEQKKEMFTVHLMPKIFYKEEFAMDYEDIFNKCCPALENKEAYMDIVNYSDLVNDFSLRVHVLSAADLAFMTHCYKPSKHNFPADISKIVLACISHINRKPNPTEKLSLPERNFEMLNELGKELENIPSLEMKSVDIVLRDLLYDILPENNVKDIGSTLAFYKKQAVFRIKEMITIYFKLEEEDRDKILDLNFQQEMEIYDNILSVEKSLRELIGSLKIIINPYFYKAAATCQVFISNVMFRKSISLITDDEPCKLNYFEYDKKLSDELVPIKMYYNKIEELCNKDCKQKWKSVLYFDKITDLIYTDTFSITNEHYAVLRAQFISDEKFSLKHPKIIQNLFNNIKKLYKYPFSTQDKKKADDLKEIYSRIFPFLN